MLTSVLLKYIQFEGEQGGGVRFRAFHRAGVCNCARNCKLKGKKGKIDNVELLLHGIAVVAHC